MTPQVSILLEHRIMCELCVYPCLIVKNFQCKIRGIFVIMKKLQDPFCKSFQLREQIQLYEGPSCKYASNHYLATLLQISPKFVVFC